jgi:hypothetical protein
MPLFLPPPPPYTPPYTPHCVTCQRDPFSFSDDDEDDDGTSFGYKFRIQIKAREVRESEACVQHRYALW